MARISPPSQGVSQGAGVDTKSVRTAGQEDDDRARYIAVILRTFTQAPGRLVMSWITVPWFMVTAVAAFQMELVSRRLR